jgi:hypothetical protein
MHDVLYRFVKLSLSSNYCLGDDGDHLICEKTESDVLFQCPWSRSDFELSSRAQEEAGLKNLELSRPRRYKMKIPSSPANS